MTTTTITNTEALGYCQEYRRLSGGERGYRRRISRLSDGALMYAGPGTDPDHPSTSHPDWTALPRQERIAIQYVLDADAERDGIAGYLSERAGLDALSRGARERGLDARAWKGQEAEDARRNASQAEFELVLQGDLEVARARLACVLRRDRDQEATRRLLEIAGALDEDDLARLAVPSPVPAKSASKWLADKPIVWWWWAPGIWVLGDGQLPGALADLAGLRRDGTLGPVRTNPNVVESWRDALRRARAQALAGAR